MFIKTPGLSYKDFVDFFFGVEGEKNQVVTDKLQPKASFRSPQGVKSVGYGVKVYGAFCEKNEPPWMTQW